MTAPPAPGTGRIIIADYGRAFEDFEPGDVYEHRPGRTITESDNIYFSLLTMNRHPLHSNNDYASRSEFGKPLVNSAFTLALVTGMTVDDVSFKAIANLGWDKVRLTAPVFVGDTVYARTRVLEKRLSGSRPGQGIVRTYTEGYKSTGEVFLSFERSSLVPTRATAPKA
jgi:itaconyl-CoA hydratase